ncbi:glycosyltransferase family 4 protein [Paenibacillus macerans]|uniref:glycosyltransferase family 4 protein n=1 Tax=Paenibacillus macerans TaxID=44252 RepID=UPI00203A84A9|nr:glycosyltransferase family 4 protein [Paenibacillus macerans]MCM3698262.1 glycosyltransferase family 4 protein [Paenibacillus macerans]
MKILLASFFELPKTGGLWTYMCQLKRGLEQLGHTVDIFSRSSGPDRYKIMNGESAVHRENFQKVIEPHVLRALSASSPQTPLWIMNQEIERYKYEAAACSFNLKQYDIIHTQDIISTYSFSRIKPSTCPLIATIHASLSFEWRHALSHLFRSNPLFHQYGLMLEHFGASSSDKTIVPSRWLKEYLVDNFHVPSEKLVVIPNGIDVPYFRELMMRQTSIKRPKNKIVFASVARLAYEKGIACLLDALGKLNATRDDWNLWLIGEGPLQQELKEQCETLKISNQVKFLGSRDDVPALLKQADMFLLSSIQETFGYSILEAQLAGVPVIVPKTGGISEVVHHKKTGLFFPTGDSEALLANIKLLLADNKLKTNIIEQAKLTASTKFSTTTTTKKVLDIYRLQQLLNARG